ncbi:MAG: putative phage tail protein [Sideroxydans sp.]
MIYADLLKHLLPPVSYDRNGVVLSASQGAEGSALDGVLESASSIHNEADARSTYSLLSDWERVSGLSALNLSVEQRRAALTAKLSAHGGQSRPYFVAMAERMGFSGATIKEFKPATCNGTCNDSLYGEPDRFVWQMNLPSAGGKFIANCNSPCNSPLGSWGTGAVENAIRALRPANTTVIFENT